MKQLIQFNTTKGASVQTLEIKGQTFEELSTQHPQGVNIVSVQTYMTIKETARNLLAERKREGIKRDKYNLINALIPVLHYLKDEKTMLLFEPTNNNRKNAKNANNAPTWNLGALTELLLNIGIDKANNSIKETYIKGSARECDIVINGVNYEIKLNSKYAASTPKHNHIRMLINVVNDKDSNLRIEEIKATDVIYKTVKDGNKTKKVMLLNQPNAKVRKDLMELLGL